MKFNLEKVKEKRLKKNLTLKDMAYILNLSNASNYQKYENGTYKFKAEMLPILSEVLDEKIENFFINWMYILDIIRSKHEIRISIDHQGIS